jgi:hypothetical protein
MPNCPVVDFKGRDFHSCPLGLAEGCAQVFTNQRAVTTKIMLANLMYHFDWNLPVELNKEDIDMRVLFENNCAENVEAHLSSEDCVTKTLHIFSDGA